MIPVKLELTNFLSYRETAVLDYQGIHLACISGVNGAGKSSILDGITWALFGKSRSKSDDDLINRLAIRQDEAMEVRFTFALEEVVYRVTRKKAYSKGTRLELQIEAGADKWKTLTESKIRETQAAIEKLLRMNYDTFINASFLLQGKADEFTTKTPNKRKEILADLMGLGIWDEYREAAAAQRKEEDGRLILLNSQIDEIGQELGEEENRTLALATVQTELDAILERLKDKELLLTEMRRTETAVQQQKQHVENLSANLTRTEQRLLEVVQTISQRQAEQAAFAEIIAQAETIEKAYSEWQTLEQSVQAWQQKADQFNRLQQEKRPFELAIAEEKSKLEAQQVSLAAQEVRVANANVERETVQATLTEAEEKLTKALTQLENLAEQEATWHEKRAQLQKLEAERTAQTQEMQRLQNQAKRMDSLRAEQTAVAGNLKQAHTQLAELVVQLNSLKEKETQQNKASAEQNGLESTQPALREQMNRLKERMDKLQDESEGVCPICGQLLSAEHRTTVLAELQVEGKEMGDRFRNNKTRIDSLATEIKTLASELKQQSRLEQNQQTQQQRHAQAEARLQEIEQTLAEWHAEGGVRLAELEMALDEDEELEALKAEVVRLGTAVQDKPTFENERQAQQKIVADGEARLAELERAIADWEAEGKKALATTTQQLAENSYATEAQTKLAELNTQIEAVGYDAQAHETARAELEKLAELPAQYQQLKQAEAAVKPLQDALADLAKQQTEQETAVTNLNAERETAVAELEKLTADEGDIKSVEDEVFQLREEQVQANRKVGAAQQRLDVLDDLRARRTQLEAQKEECSRQIQRLKLLEKACGKSGVQALLIEQALPEIEERANELLDRLTGGEMRLLFSTQKKLKSRDAVAETLEIKISDPAGERPYENFSGGEQFRVNFAIRLALSQLLAHRSGARLQTLVIDEGFGSQDPNGRQRLVEAINIIEKDFAVIMIITHIDELRDAFPQRIEVEKRPSGSFISVS